MEERESVKMKRFFGFFLFAVILAGILLAGNAFAAERGERIEILFPGYENNSGPSYEALDVYVEDMEAFRSRLIADFEMCREEVDLYGYKIPLSLINELAFYIWKDIPEAFHVSGLSYSYRASSGLIDKLYPEYDLTKTEYTTLLTRCEEIAAKLLTGLDDPRLSEADKALVLHDRLAVHNEYDVSLNAPYTHEMVGALVNQTSVCEGYAMAYSYLLDQLGIRNYYCQSERINHGWNVVYIDGVKYHVDVTWDDPLYDRMGRVYHDNFLRSTNGMLETGHYQGNSYDFDATPTDSRYDEAYWQNSSTAFQVLDGKLYYIDFSGNVPLLKMADDGEHQVLADVSDTWRTSLGNWGNGYPVLSSDGVDLLYSGGDRIYRYCTENGNIQTIWTPSLPDGTAIFGFRFADGYLNCVYYDTPNFVVDTNHTNLIRQSYAPHSHAHEHSYTDACDADCNLCGEIRTPPHVYDGETDRICNLCSHERPSFTAGDVDGDAVVDLDDAIYLLYHVNFKDTYPVNQPVDFNGDAKEDLDDAIYLLYHVNFKDTYPLH